MTAIVTGFTSGLGQELALEMARNGKVVIGVSRKEAVGMEAEALIAKKMILQINGDVSEEVTVRRAFNLAEQSGQLDLVINCAGQGVFGSAGSVTRTKLDDVFRANLIGTILFSDKAFEIFKERGGTLVNVLSTAAQVGRANESIYCASKWGARGYTEALRVEAKATKAMVHAVYVGGMNTNFWGSADGAKVDSSGFMDPVEVAGAILDSLGSRSSVYVSDIVINRGRTDGF